MVSLHCNLGIIHTNNVITISLMMDMYQQYTYKKEGFTNELQLVGQN